MALATVVQQEISGGHVTRARVYRRVSLNNNLAWELADNAWALCIRVARHNGPSGSHK
jgi:hypothetical protein